MTTKITEQNISNLANIGVQWQAVFVGDGSTGLTTVAGRGYFINTTSGTVTVTLPASPSAGDVVVLKDYARTWGTNAVSMASNLFDEVSRTQSFSTNGQTVTLVYMDGTKGWSLINEDTTSGLGAEFVAATGGTVTTSGDFKIHTFTGDGCFVVSAAGNPAGGTIVDYLVVAGGGGAGTNANNGPQGASGGGAGGFRVSNGYGCSSCLMSPLANPTGITASVTTYPVTVGGGGTGAASSPYSGANGSNSVFSTITSAGGGFGSGDVDQPEVPGVGGPGGSGGGSHQTTPSRPTGAGNTPPVSPPQGNPGAGGSSPSGEGGGGAGGAGINSGWCGVPTNAGKGGVGSYVIQAGFAGCNGTPGPVGSTRYFAGGGGGSSSPARSPGGVPGPGGAGGGGNGGVSPTPSANQQGGTNTGGGGGATSCSPGEVGSGGSGIVVIRYKFQ